MPTRISAYKKQPERSQHAGSSRKGRHRRQSRDGEDPKGHSRFLETGHALDPATGPPHAQEHFWEWFEGGGGGGC